MAERFISSLRQFLAYLDNEADQRVGKQLEQMQARNEDRMLASSLYLYGEAIAEGLNMTIPSQMKVTLVLGHIRGLCDEIRRHPNYSDCVGFQINQDQVATEDGIVPIEELGGQRFLTLEQIGWLTARFSN